MKAKEFITEDTVPMHHHKKNFLDMFQKFLPIAMKYIGITHLPTIKFEAHIHDDIQPTFGKYENGEHVLYVALLDRHPNDMGGKDVIIKLLDGTYTDSFSAANRCYGLGSISIQGNTSTPSNTKITVNSNYVLYNSGSGVEIGIEYVQLKFTGSSPACIQADQGARINLGNGIIFDSSSGSHIAVTNNGSVRLASKYTIIGSAVYNHIACTTGFIFKAGISEVTLTGTPNFGNSFIDIRSNSIAALAGITYTGSATGTKFLVSTNSLIATAGGGINYFPGDVAGTTDSATGGVYV